MKKIWQEIIKFLNTKPDAKVALAENKRSFQMILIFGLLDCLLMILTEYYLHGRIRLNAAVGAGSFIFVILYSSLRWKEIKENMTWALEVLIFLFIFLVSYVDCSMHPDSAVFITPVIMILLPPMIFDKPWKLLVILGVNCAFALVICRYAAAGDVWEENLTRLISAGFLSAVNSCWTAYSRILSVEMRKSTQVIAEHDHLTGVYNRGGGTFLIRSSVERQESGMFMIVDIDNFKNVNDTYGHQKGDEILRKAAETLRNSFKSSDIVMRMGGDEFIIYAVGMVDYTVCETRLERMSKALHNIWISEKDGSFVTASIGAVINDGSYPTYDSLYETADRYLYQSKEKGKDCFTLLGKSYNRKN